MSRVPPFPTRHRSPSQSNGNSYNGTQPIPTPGTSSVRPLNISRPGQSSRSTSPSNTPFISGSPHRAHLNLAPIGPLRPQRSELRSRVSEYSGSERASTSSQDLYRDSFATTRSDTSGPYRSHPNAPNNVQTTMNPRNQRLRSTDDGENETPTSLTSVLSAFQSRRKMTLESDDMDYHKEREDELEAEKLRQQRIRDKVPGRQVKRNARAGDIDMVLDQVKDGWEFVMNPDFNSVDLALQLLDQSSLGKDIDSFRQTKNTLTKALKGSVDKHYQAFAASLPHHASLLARLSTTHEQISSARTSLLETKEALGNKRADLVQLWTRGQMLEEMIRILNQIERLKTVPDLLETLMSEKRLLQASVLLVRSLKIINKADMLEIGAVSDLRAYLNGQESALREILIDELQSHLYLKSFWCESRWTPYVPNQYFFSKPDYEREYDSGPSSSLTSPSVHQSRLAHFLDNLILRPNDPPYDVSEITRNDHETSVDSGEAIPIPSSNPTHPSNPEADSFTYMETLLESLAVLGTLGVALDNVAQRLPGEVFNLLETTLDEVEERAEYGKRRSMFSLNGGLGRSETVYVFSPEDSSITSPLEKKGPFLRASTLRLSALESSAKRMDHEILRDLFWSLYSKLDAVAQGLRVVSEVSNRIGARRDFKENSETKPGVLFPLVDTWHAVQVEVRTLIQDYLTDGEQGTASGRSPISSINEILREGKFIRDKSKSVFRLGDTDMKQMNKVLRLHEEGLTRVLKETMPGLVAGNPTDATQITTASSSDERMLDSDQHHRLLIPADAFHVTVLFQPTLAFLHRMSEVLPAGAEASRASSAVLDEFVLKVYLPQLEEKVSELFHQAVTGPEAFQPDPLSTRLSPEPLIKASTHLIALINSLGAMLRTTPFHKDNYSRLILGVVIQFYQRCSDRFQSLTTTSIDSDHGARISLAAQWAQRSELHPCLSELWNTAESKSTKQYQLWRQETNIELEFLGQKVIYKEDLIPSMQNLEALASLYRSVLWFCAELKDIKASPEDQLSPTSAQGLGSINNPIPVTPYLPSTPLETPLQTFPFSREMSLRFQALIKTYDQLSSLILDTIRIDLRCRTMFYLDCTMRHGNYLSAYEAAEPDPYVVDLNAELMHADEFTSLYLPEVARTFVFTGLGHLMEHMLISNARYLRTPNDFGVKKIIRNMLALQQSIKALLKDEQYTEFERAKQYYSLFFISPQEMIEKIRQHQEFTFDEYQTMLNLQCGVNPEESNGASKAQDRNYSSYVIDLHGLELENS